MRKLTLSLFVLVLLFAGSQEVLAQCPTVTGPHFGGGQIWYDYAIAPSCYNTWNTTYPVTNGCGNNAIALGDSGSATFSFTVGNQVLNSTKWRLSTRVNFNDPNNSTANWVAVGVNVTHTNNVVDQYWFVSWDGPDGDLTGCLIQSGFFTANTGDQIQVVIQAAAAVGTPTISVEPPVLVNNQY
ncbi:MAG TPA: hypothetical protein VHK90_18545 [Thermoanaerobaculia bacterium]|nr:hypothetical protein [Thermoanaerobaculia bacterium]